MRRWLTILTLGLGLGLATLAEATPTCTTTTTVPSGGTVTGAYLLTPGNCVESGDKIFGDFTANGSFSGAGSASFTFLSTPGDVTIGFAGVLAPSSVSTLNYDVAVDPALAGNFLIDDFQADFTLNSATQGSFAAATLTAAAFGIDCTRTVNPSGTTCPQTVTFARVADLLVSETITTGPNTIVTGLTNTVSQSVPEPSTLLLLGSSLIGLAWIGRRHGAA